MLLVYTYVIGILATAEPPLCMSCSLPLAIRNAVASARADADVHADRWYAIGKRKYDLKFFKLVIYVFVSDGPSTVENTFINSLNHYKDYLL